MKTFKIKQAYGLFIGIVLGIIGCQMINTFRQKAVVRLASLHSVYYLAALYCEHEDWFYRVASDSLDGLIIGCEKYSFFLTSDEKFRKQKLYEGVFQLRQAYPPEKSENEAFQWFQDQANLILKQNREEAINNSKNEFE